MSALAQPTIARTPRLGQTVPRKPIVNAGVIPGIPVTERVIKQVREHIIDLIATEDERNMALVVANRTGLPTASVVRAMALGWLAEERRASCWRVGVAGVQSAADRAATAVMRAAS